MHALLNPTRVQSVSYDDADLFGLKPFNYQRTLLTTDRMRRRPNLPNLRYGCLLQKLQSIVPQSLDNLAGGFCPSQFGGLSSPHLHPLSVSSFARRFPHERGESALNRVGAGRGPSNAARTYAVAMLRPSRPLNAHVSVVSWASARPILSA